MTKPRLIKKACQNDPQPIALNGHETGTNCDSRPSVATVRQSLGFSPNGAVRPQIGNSPCQARAAFAALFQ